MGYCTSGMCMGNQIADASAFNAQDRSKTDHNWDLTALLRYEPDATQTYEAGIAQKTRSPNLYERYTWSTWPMAAIMNNFVGDGNGYVGDINLKPEVALHAERRRRLARCRKRSWSVRVAPYITHVRDYIDADLQWGQLP
jgi:iron complex outermembrane recepter protein